MAPDPRLEIGATIHVKAKMVRSGAECARICGSAAGIKLLTGTVTAVVRVLTATNRRSTWVTARFEVPYKTYFKRLGLRSCRPGQAPTNALPTPAISLPPNAQALATGSSTTGLLTPGSGPAGADVRSPALFSTSGTQAIPSGQTAAMSAAPGSFPGGTTSYLAAVPAPGTPRAQEAPRAARLVTVHGLEWRDQDILQPIGGPDSIRTWSVSTPAADSIVEGGDSVGHERSRTPLDYFLAVFPPQELLLIVELTAAQLSARGRPPKSPEEILKLFGVLLLGSRFEFGSRADLWSTSHRTSVAVGGFRGWKGRGPSAVDSTPSGRPQNIPIRASKGMTCPNLREIGSGRGRGFSLVVFPTPLLLV